METNYRDPYLFVNSPRSLIALATLTLSTSWSRLLQNVGFLGVTFSQVYNHAFAFLSLLPCSVANMQ